MRLETREAEPIANAHEVSSMRLATRICAGVLRKGALAGCGAARDGILLSGNGEPFVRFGAGSPDKRARFVIAHGAASASRLRTVPGKRALDRQEICRKIVTVHKDDYGYKKA